MKRNAFLLAFAILMAVIFLAPLAFAGEFEVIDGTKQAKPFWAVKAKGVFTDKRTYDSQFEAKIIEALRNFATKWKEVSHDTLVDGDAVRVDRNGMNVPLPNIRRYWVEQRFKEGGEIVSSGKPKPTPNRRPPSPSAPGTGHRGPLVDPVQVR